ncbi:M14 family metallopeptidase [Sporosarcina sp. CAU 1771]
MEKFWSTNGVFVDKNNDHVIDGVSLYIDLPEGLMPIGLIDFCARIGYETTEFSFDLFEQKQQRVHMEFQESYHETVASFQEEKLLVTYRNDEELSDLLRELAYADLQKEMAEETSFYSEIKSLSQIWSHSGFGTHNEASPTRTLSLSVDVQENVLSTSLLKELCYFTARAALYSTALEFPITKREGAKISFTLVEGTQNKLLLTKDNAFQLEGPIDQLPKTLHSFSRSTHWSEGGSMGFWEEQLVHDSTKEAKLLLEEKWSDVGEVEEVFKSINSSVYLDGSSIEVYLSEPIEVREALQEKWKNSFPQIETITIRSAFKTAFHWFSEELIPLFPMGIKKIIISVKKEENLNALELPIRWIQEIYPIDRYIEEMTQIQSDQVIFTLEEEQKHTYIVFAELENGETITLGCLDVPISKMAYVDGVHSVYPSTSALRIVKNGSLVEEKIIETDRARFYSYYMNKVLPKLRASTSNFNEGQGHSRPLFDRIEIEVWISEEEAKLPVDEERISALEALHEDLYFNTLDYFAKMGEDLDGKPFNAPGGIQPFMHVHVGENPKAVIRIYKWDDVKVKGIKTNEIVFDMNGNLLDAIMETGTREIIVPIQSFIYPKEHVHPMLSTWLSTVKNHRIVYPAFSYLGNAIPVIECFGTSEETFYSALKMTLMKKTLFIEAGHHANEVSSTPAIVQLLETNTSMVKDLLQKINIVIIPMANPDGYQLLERLMIEHPEWKHHAARYNAVGLEFAHVRFQQTAFTEANVYAEIMRKWAPDVLVDNHGIPAHEWIQPFAGYNSPPRFPVSYFLPSAKIYGIGRVSAEVNHKLQKKNLEEIVQAVSTQIQGSAIAVENEYWKKRFKKYGNDWLPNTFPIEEASGIHFYREMSVTPTYTSVGILRYPDWVAADVITEAADEIVSGNALDTCVEAQMKFNLAVLKLVANAKSSHTMGTASKKRNRPILL